MRALPVVVVAGLILSGCSSGLNRPPSEITATTDSDGVQRVTVVAHSFYFEPNRVVVKADKPVELHVKNASLIIPHNMTCIAQEAGVNVHEGLGLFKDSETVRFTPTKTGEYPFFCAKDAHSKKGMTGTLVVVH